MFRVLLIGPPGSGKGTQSTKLAEKLSLMHLSTGDIFRSEIASGSELGKRLEDVIKRGQLVEDELVFELVESRISTVNSFILDGFPRNLTQGKRLDAILNQRKSELTHIFEFVVPDNELFNRLAIRKAGGRPDDSEEVIVKRLDVYRNECLPLLDYYRGYREVVSINGVGSTDEIFDKLMGHLVG